MRTSRNGLLFIGGREGLVLCAYPDGPHLSIGFGHNDAALKPGDTITVARAFDMLRADVAKRENWLNDALKNRVSQPQFDALMSLRYQSGNRYAPMLVESINGGDLERAAAMFPECDHNLAGVRVPGLRVRRLAEQAMFLRGDYGPLGSVPFWSGDPRKTRRREYVVQPGDIAP